MKVFTLAVVTLDPAVHPVRALREKAMMEKLNGLVGIVPGAGCALIAFATAPHAEKAREKFLRMRISCGKYIMIATLSSDRKHLQIHEPVCGWDQVDPADLDIDPSGIKEVVEILDRR